MSKCFLELHFMQMKMQHQRTTYLTKKNKLIRMNSLRKKMRTELQMTKSRLRNKWLSVIIFLCLM